MKWDFYVNFSLHIVNICLFVFKYKEMDIFLRLVGCCLLLTCCFEVYAAKLMIEKQDNNFLYHFLVPAQFIFYSIAYATIVRRKLIKYLIRSFVPIFIAISIYTTLKLEGLNEYNSIVCSAKHFLLTFWVLFYMLDIFFEEGNIILWKSPHFCTSVGLIVASLGNFFIEGLMNHMILLSNDFALSFYLIGVAIVYLYYAFVTVSFFIVKKSA
jgi:hypothetical protein